MRVLYISTYDIKGGAARGAYRLHRGFLENGVQSRLLVNNKYSEDITVTGPESEIGKALSTIRPYLAKWLLKLQSSPNTFPHSINVFPSNLVRYINTSDADVVLLHWIGHEMISIREIGRIKKKIVWRLADQWAFCGSEHYTVRGEDRRYIEGYLVRNKPDGHRGLDLDRWTWKRKAKHWLDKPMTVVTGSRWLADCAKASVLFRNKEVNVIPSGLDIGVYKPADKMYARRVLNLPMDKKLVLFGSLSATSDLRKGFHLLLTALDSLAEQAKAEVSAVVVGASKSEQEPNCKLPFHYLSTLKDDWSLVLAYSAADVFVLPTMQDNLPYTVIEAMSCGTPCVSFAVGGLPEMIEHNVNGYLARPYDCEDLANGMRIILEDDRLHSTMSQECRQKALTKYDVNIQVKSYLKLFEEL